MVGQPLPFRATRTPAVIHSPDSPPQGTRWLLNLVVFQTAWVATVLGAARGLAWIGPAAVAAAVALHLWLTPTRAAEARLIALALILGLAVEHSLLWAGLIRYQDSPVWVPLWMLALWPLFATTLNVSLAWFKTRLLAAGLFAAVAGPLAYWGGASLGAIGLPQPSTGLLTLAAIWAVAFPGLLVTARNLEYTDSERARR